jgi:hypothetical protein
MGKSRFYHKTFLDKTIYDNCHIDLRIKILAKKVNWTDAIKIQGNSCGQGGRRGPRRPGREKT